MEDLTKKLCCTMKVEVKIFFSSKEASTTALKLLQESSLNLDSSSYHQNDKSITVFDEEFTVEDVRQQTASKLDDLNKKTKADQSLLKDSTETVAVITFKCPEKFGAMIESSLRVDRQPKGSTAQRSFSVTHDTVTANITCQEVRELRVSVNSFLDLLYLSIDTIRKFNIETTTHKRRKLDDDIKVLDSNT